MKPSDWVEQVQQGLDKALTEHLTLTQGELGKANPKDTGRMASSWFIGQNRPPTDVRPEGWAEPGAKRVVLPEYTGRITFDGTWYISNNLPYAQRVALDPKWAKGGAGGADWFTRIVNQQQVKLNQRLQKHAPR